jgi:hypothetical protein
MGLNFFTTAASIISFVACPVAFGIAAVGVTFVCWGYKVTSDDAFRENSQKMISALESEFLYVKDMLNTLSKVMNMMQKDNGKYMVMVQIISYFKNIGKPIDPELCRLYFIEQ